MLIGILAAAVLVSVIRIYQYKKQIRDFAKVVQKRKRADWNKPVTVDYFNKDIIALADILNEYIDMYKEREQKYENDRNQLKSVIAGISHDFRTPLTAAKGYLQMLEKSGSLNEKEKEYLGIAMEKVAYLKLLSDDFFEISSLESKGDEVETSLLNVGNFLSEYILQQYKWIEEEGLRTDFQLPESDVFIQTNEHYLERMIENLFSNVRKYVKSYIGMKVVYEGAELLIIIENDLEGMEAPDTGRIFAPFYRDNAGSNEGSGLGLYVVECLAKRLGIKINAEFIDRIFRITMKIKTV